MGSVINPIALRTARTALMSAIGLKKTIWSEASRFFSKVVSLGKSGRDETGKYIPLKGLQSP